LATDDGDGSLGMQSELPFGAEPALNTLALVYLGRAEDYRDVVRKELEKHRFEPTSGWRAYER
jgi:hypothetical protein